MGSHKMYDFIANGTSVNNIGVLSATMVFFGTKSPPVSQGHKGKPDD